VKGEEVAQVGPGAILGEGAIVEGGRRNATLRACTPARVAVIAAEQIDRGALEALATGRRVGG
jgi:CRP-like cAMP-binding protein